MVTTNKYNELLFKLMLWFALGRGSTFHVFSAPSQPPTVNWAMVNGKEEMVIAIQSTHWDGYMNGMN